MIHGHFRSLGHNVPQSHISESLQRIDPIGRIFRHHIIERKAYSVASPNTLWHHDGQHGKMNIFFFWPPAHMTGNFGPYWLTGLIAWGIGIHGFVDGHSRLIVGMEAANNNQADTVFGVFLRAANKYRVPSHVQGDHGAENVKVAAFMAWFRGDGRGSYIWGRYVNMLEILFQPTVLM